MSVGWKEHWLRQRMSTAVNDAFRKQSDSRIMPVGHVFLGSPRLGKAVARTDPDLRLHIPAPAAGAEGMFVMVTAKHIVDTYAKRPASSPELWDAIPPGDAEALELYERAKSLVISFDVADAIIKDTTAELAERRKQIFKEAGLKPEDDAIIDPAFPATPAPATGAAEVQRADSVVAVWPTRALWRHMSTALGSAEAFEGPPNLAANMDKVDFGWPPAAKAWPRLPVDEAQATPEDTKWTAMRDAEGGPWIELTFEYPQPLVTGRVLGLPEDAGDAKSLPGTDPQTLTEHCHQCYTRTVMQAVAPILAAMYIRHTERQLGHDALYGDTDPMGMRVMAEHFFPYKSVFLADVAAKAPPTPPQPSPADAPPAEPPATPPPPPPPTQEPVWVYMPHKRRDMRRFLFNSALETSCDLDLDAMRAVYRLRIVHWFEFERIEGAQVAQFIKELCERDKLDPAKKKKHAKIVKRAVEQTYRVPYTKWINHYGRRTEYDYVPPSGPPPASQTSPGDPAEAKEPSLPPLSEAQIRDFERRVEQRARERRLRMAIAEKMDKRLPKRARKKKTPTATTPTESMPPVAEAEEEEESSSSSDDEEESDPPAKASV